MDDWLSRARDAIAPEDVDRARLELSEADADTLLDLARIAAHVSGERTNAPLLCYLIGRAQGDRPLDELAEAVRRSTS
ncbi:MAG: hypothetical protein H0W90_15815 [Actinobacteria bacterium]|nr:hypothetical protein [Actinomycetota bacterium]